MKVTEELLIDAAHVVAETEKGIRVNSPSPGCAGCGWGCAGIVGD